MTPAADGPYNSAKLHLCCNSDCPGGGPKKGAVSSRWCWSPPRPFLALWGCRGANIIAKSCVQIIAEWSKWLSMSWTELVSDPSKFYGRHSPLLLIFKWNVYLGCGGSEPNSNGQKRPGHTGFIKKKLMGIHHDSMFKLFKWNVTTEAVV